MIKSRLGIVLLTLLVCFAAAPAGAAEAERRVAEVPLVSLKTWQESSEQERYGFLVGFVTMLELERQWQGQNPLPLKKSLVQSWARGFSGVSLKQIHDTLNEYIAANPKDLDRQVVEVLWFKFAQPNVKETVSDPDPVKNTKKALKKKESRR